MVNVGIISAGALGTAMAQTLSSNDENNILLWGRNQELVDGINSNHINSFYYPNIILNDKIIATSNLEDFNLCDLLILAIPSSIIREMMEKIIKIIPSTCEIITSIKGIELSTFKTMSQIISEYVNNDPFVLSGPNIAREIVEGLPAATSIAGKGDFSLIKKVFSNTKIKVDYSNDVFGCESCGIIKNIIAISQGILEGMNINYNAKFAFFTKSFLEAKDIIEVLGGDRNTVDSYCGFGDIVTASLLPVSRNHTLGVLSGQNIVIDEKASGVIFEGKNTAKVMKEICDKNNIKSVTVDFVYNVIIKNKNPKVEFTRMWELL